LGPRRRRPRNDRPLDGDPDHRGHHQRQRRPDEELAAEGELAEGSMKSVDKPVTPARGIAIIAIDAIRSTPRTSRRKTPSSVRQTYRRVARRPVAISQWLLQARSGHAAPAMSLLSGA
jgi:hypothetical protein